MLSLLLDRHTRRCGLGMLIFGLVALVPATVHAQQALEPIAPTRIVVHGSESHFDLADLGPDFSEIWLQGVLPVLTESDAAPALMQRITLAAADEEWSRRTRTTYERTKDGQPLIRHVERWDGTMWTDAERTTYIYRDYTLARQHTAVWVDGAWQPDRELTFAYDDDGHIREVIHRTRRDERWAKAARLTINPADTSRQHTPRTHASQRTLETLPVQRRVIRETWSDSTWTPATRVTFTVAEEGRHIIQRNETWTGTRWEASVRLAFMYDGAGYPIEKAVDVWTGAQWAEGPLQLYDYEMDGSRVEQRTETWIGTNRIRTERTELTYTTPLQTWLLSTASPSD